MRSYTAPDPAAADASGLAPSVRDAIDARPLAHSVPNAAKQLGISKALAYELIAEGKIEARKIRGRTVILDEELVRYARSLPVREAS